MYGIRLGKTRCPVVTSTLVLSHLTVVSYIQSLNQINYMSRLDKVSKVPFSIYRVGHKIF